MRSAVRRVLRGVQRLWPPARDGVLILCYHLVGAGTDSVVDLPLDTFERQIGELLERVRIVGLDSALQLLQDGTDGRGLHVVVTFDDAYLNFATHAWPVLERHKVPATLYAPVAFLDGRLPAPMAGAGHLPPISWSCLRDLMSSGLLSVGSHSLTHPDLRRLPPAEVQSELVQSKAILEERLGVSIDGFCYPRALWSRGVRERVRGVYRSAVVAGGRWNRPGAADLHALSRLPVRRDMPPSIRPVLQSSVWLEEWVASQVRPWLH